MSSFSLRSATCMRRSGSGNGSGRISPAFTTLNTTVLAAIPSATIRTATMENAGVLRSVLSA